jgi:S1-C subfamily serine protease
MKSRAFISNLSVALLSLTVLPARAASVLETMNAEVTALYEKSRAAVLKVHAEMPTTWAQPTLGPRHRIGSGFLINDEGQLVTAGTLVEGAETYWVEWKGRRVEAVLLAHDRQTNLAFLEIDPDDCGLAGQPPPHLTFGNSDELRVGSMVVAIGFPYDQPSAPVVGFVAGLDTQCGQRVFPVPYIRAGCRLRPGQGGGPLLNARGEIVGLVVAAHGDDQCYALPGNAVQKVVRDIRERGEPQHGWVGLSVGEHAILNPTGEPAHWQVYVQAVMSNTPAAQAGFQARDVVLQICSNDIRRAADVLNTMFYRRCGESLKMTVLRAGVTQEVTVAVGRRPPAVTESLPRPPAHCTPKIVPVSESR